MRRDQASARPVFLIGTKHDYQLPGKRGAHQFRDLLFHVVLEHCVRAIAEEMSSDGLFGRQQSTCLEVAEACGLAHRYCDPNTAERQALGILVDEDTPRMAAFFSGRDPQEAQAEVKASHGCREQFWLDGLLDLDTWPVLFVCGQAHTDRFRTLLETNRLVVHLLFTNWVVP